MSKSLQNILGLMPLTESLRATASGVPNPFPQELFAVNPANQILGDRARYIRITGERRTSKLAKYGAPARARDLRDISDQNVRLLHTMESYTVDPLVLQQLQSFERYEQDKGLEWLNYQNMEAAKRHVNTRVIATASVLRYGAIYWDSDGNLLPSSAGASETYSFQVPATHQNQINSIITASWATANTDIPGHIRNVRQYAAQETGVLPTTCLYGINIPKYFTQNDYVSEYLSRNPSLNDQFLSTAEIPDGLFGMKWIPVYDSFYEDYNGTNQEIWDDDLVVMLPDISQPDKMTWWSMYEGSYQVPRTLDVQADAMAAMKSLETVHGMASYAVAGLNPPGVTCYTLDTFLPALRNEKAIFQIDTAF